MVNRVESGDGRRDDPPSKPESLRSTEGKSVRKGEPWVFATGGTLILMITLVFGVIVLLLLNGLGFFWPSDLQQVEQKDGTISLGIEWGEEEIPGADGGTRTQYRVGNPKEFPADFVWIDDDQVASITRPDDALLVETLTWSPRIGRFAEARRDGEVVLRSTDADWFDRYDELVEEAEEERIHGKLAPDVDEASLIGHYLLSDGQEIEIPLAAVVRTVRPNSMGTLAKAGVYVSRVWEFLAAQPRESNTAGGVFPAILGTVLMVLIMTLAVVPLGVVGALYLNEYAKQGPLVRLVRLAVSNLAGVPSIVFGMFGLAFFIHIVGSGIDSVFFADEPGAVFGTGGLLWASLTLALLTVPVVIISTEEALRATPRAQREGALALGATKWQSIRTVILPASLPGILTGVILAIARGAGEVAPLMLTGVMKLAPSPLIDGTAPYLHADRKFMHLGFHIYDLAFQSPNIEASKPIVYATALLLLVLVVALNLTAILFRNHVRRRLMGGVF